MKTPRAMILLGLSCCVLASRAQEDSPGSSLFQSPDTVSDGSMGLTQEALQADDPQIAGHVVPMEAGASEALASTSTSTMTGIIWGVGAVMGTMALML